MKKEVISQNDFVGIDEAGRGPLAGPVAVGIVKIPENFKQGLLKIFGELKGTRTKVKDSKLLTEEKRLEVFEKLKKLKREGRLDYICLLTSAKDIDKKGISKVIASSIEKGLIKIGATREKSRISLDGSLKAPRIYPKQKTIIKGDQTELLISLASIVAKVTRDNFMCRIAKKYPKYKLDIHKGYGTKLHRDLIKEFGVSDIHRQSFCRNLIK